MFKDFRHKNLRGQSFRGQDLVDADFSGADLRGVNFTNAILSGATFKQARFGLTYSWTIVLEFGLLFLSLVSAFILGYVGAFVGGALKKNDPLVDDIFLTLTFVLLIIFFLITIYKGLAEALSAFAIAIATTFATISATIMALPDTCNSEKIIEIILVSLAIALVIVGVTIPGFLTRL